MKLDKLAGTTQFYIPESAMRKFLDLRAKNKIEDIDLNIVIDFECTRGKPNLRILNGNFKENRFVEIKRDAE